MTNKIVFQFPGQGSQAVGMGAALRASFASARLIFEEVDDALDQDLSGLMRDGPVEALTLTENAQPALMAVSVAAVRVLEKDFGIPITKAAFVAGHSLGEYSALTAACALDVRDTARLLKLRGQAMQRAVPAGEGGMASLIGPKVTLELAEEIAGAGSRFGVCVVANDNNVGNVVISGAKAAVDAALAEAKARGVRAIPLAVSAPFHCPLMAPAANEMAAALNDATIEPPKVPLIPNVTVEATREPDTIRALLIDQVTGRVRWRETITKLADQDTTHFVEIGTGSVLTGMSKRIAKDATSISLQSAEDMEAFATTLMA